MDDEQFYVDLREAVLLAEQSLMYTFNFNLTAVTPYRFMRRAYRSFQTTIDPECNKWWLLFAHTGREPVSTFPDVPPPLHTCHPSVCASIQLHLFVQSASCCACWVQLCQSAC